MGVRDDGDGIFTDDDARGVRVSARGETKENRDGGAGEAGGARGVDGDV